MKWLLRQRDQCSVSYSRFGIPGDAGEERPLPTAIFLAPFNENHPDFMFFKVCHAEKAAIASAGFGMSFVILMFIISAFFEVHWYDHKKGVDVIALLLLFFYLGFGLLIHYNVVVGIKRQIAHYMLPFIVVYMVIIGAEAIAVFLQLTLIQNKAIIFDQGSNNVLFVSVFFIIIIITVQSIMLASVIKCRLYLSRKEMHKVAVRVAEKSRTKNPGILIVMGSRSSAVPESIDSIGNGQSAGVYSETFVASNNSEAPNGNASHYMAKPEPPPYEASASSVYSYDQPLKTTQPDDQQ